MNKVNGFIEIKPDEFEIIGLNKEVGGGASQQSFYPSECVLVGKTLT